MSNDWKILEPKVNGHDHLDQEHEMIALIRHIINEVFPRALVEERETGVSDKTFLITPRPAVLIVVTLSNLVTGITPELAIHHTAINTFVNMGMMDHLYRRVFKGQFPLTYEGDEDLIFFKRLLHHYENIG